MSKIHFQRSCATQSLLNFDKMNPDCQLLILDELDFQSLMMIAQTSDYYKSLALGVFNRKYGHKTIRIMGSFMYGTMDTVTESNDQITIKDYDMALMMFNTFGSVIQKLEMALRFVELNQRQVIHEHVSKYCSDSLHSISLRDLVEDELEEFSIPFKNVKNLSVSRNFIASDGKFKVTHVFPNIRRLELNQIQEFDGFILDVLIPTLEEVKILFPFSQGLQMGLELFFKKNPQIRSLNLLFYNSMYSLEIANKFLPNLEELSINFENQAHIPDNEIHFSNVKKLTTSTSGRNYFNIITFKHLEELYLTCDPNECTDFLEKNRNLKKLQITTRSISDAQIMMIGKLLMNLKEFSIKNEGDINVDTIIRLTKEIEQLEKLKLNLPGNTLYETLSQHLATGWEIRKEGEIIFIEKLTI